MLCNRSISVCYVVRTSRGTSHGNAHGSPHLFPWAVTRVPRAVPRVLNRRPNPDPNPYHPRRPTVHHTRHMGRIGTSRGVGHRDTYETPIKCHSSPWVRKTGSPKHSIYAPMRPSPGTRGTPRGCPCGTSHASYEPSAWGVLYDGPVQVGRPNRPMRFLNCPMGVPWEIPRELPTSGQVRTISMMGATCKRFVAWALFARLLRRDRSYRTAMRELRKTPYWARGFVLPRPLGHFARENGTIAVPQYRLISRRGPTARCGSGAGARKAKGESYMY